MDTVQHSLDSAGSPVETRPLPPKLEARLQDLIPIAMVIVGGCETCAEKMVARALKEGSSWQDVDKTLRIIASMQKLDCFANGVGMDVVARMDKPLAAGRKTLEEATSGECKGCSRKVGIRMWSVSIPLEDSSLPRAEDICA